MTILSVSSLYHDSAVSLIKNGQILFSIEEERFSRIKHDNSFPIHAISYVLRTFSKEKINAIAYYEKPLLKFERILSMWVATYPSSFIPFVKNLPEWLTHKITIEQKIRKETKLTCPVYFVPHHLSHASAAFLPSPFKKAAIVTIDGVGEYQTTGIWKGSENTITQLKAISFPHSLGLLYSTFTAFLGFRVNEDEWKMMGLSAYGKTSYLSEVEKIIDRKPDGSFHLRLPYFSFQESTTMWSKTFEELFGKPRRPHEKITNRHKNIAASIQKITEEMYLSMLRFAHTQYQVDSVCIGGGVALNALANGRVQKETPFKNVYVFGASGDGGASVGAGLYLYHNLSKNSKRTPINSLQLGTIYNNQEIENILKSIPGITYKRFASKKDLLETAVNLLKKEKIIGWFQGKCELGPRALGGRSILAHAGIPSMKEQVNMIKIREQYRPFAISILKSEASKYLIAPRNTDFPFMNFCFKVRREKQNKIPSVVHADETCRIQTVNKTNGIYYDLLRMFYKKTGVPGHLNTSFNLKGEPIVEHPSQAINDFLKTRMDALIIENFLVTKN
jgi:carbamoyltransferase